VVWVVSHTPTKYFYKKYSKNNKKIKNNIFDLNFYEKVYFIYNF
jgi:hypothetical protein